jgi:hypothetical protein
MTSSDETLRFFEAGYLDQDHKLLVRQKGVPLISCLAQALNSKPEKVWAIGSGNDCNVHVRLAEGSNHAFP